MTDAGDNEQVSRIVALISQAQSDRLESELKPFTPFFEGLADKLDAVLSTFSSGSIKCSVSQFGLEQVDPETLPPHGKPFRSHRGEFRLFLRAERAFDGLLCELCFGGSGSDLHGVEEGSRPASRIEQFLRTLTFDGLHEGLPEVVQELTDIALNVVEEEPNKKKTASGAVQMLKCVRVSLLVNAFSLSAEIEVLVPMIDLEALFGNVSGKKSGQTRSMGEVLSDCQFELVASLAPQEIGLDHILNLSVGSVLKLKATPSHPSLLHVEGVEIGRANLNITSDQIAVSLI